MSELKYLYTISILPPEEGGGYLIEFPDLPGCISDGETLDETIANGKDAMLCWIETAKQHGDEIPLSSSSVRSLEPSESVTEQDENPSDVDPHNVIHQYKSAIDTLPPTFQFDWPISLL